METFESKGLKVNLGKPKVLVCDRITKDGMSKNKVDSYSICSLRVNANSVLCIHCGKWIYGRCAGMKRVKFQGNFTCRKCDGNIGEAVEQEVKLCFTVFCHVLHSLKL